MATPFSLKRFLSCAVVMCLGLLVRVLARSSAAGVGCFGVAGASAICSMLEDEVALELILKEDSTSRRPDHHSSTAAFEAFMACVPFSWEAPSPVAATVAATSGERMTCSVATCSSRCMAAPVWDGTHGL
mmetsp:Transcript_60247/g.138233  ORF Transcript_60247/g.138233 Transcript_60247/m.138233 type:complete len:130 (-) Transcript_60247:114-503(-)